MRDQGPQSDMREAPTVTLQEFEAAIRPFLDSVERDYGVQLFYVLFPGDGDQIKSVIQMTLCMPLATPDGVFAKRCDHIIPLVRQWVAWWENQFVVMPSKE